MSLVEGERRVYYITLMTRSSLTQRPPGGYLRAPLLSPAAASPNSLHVASLTILVDGTNRRVTFIPTFHLVDSDSSLLLWWIGEYTFPPMSMCLSMLGPSAFVIYGAGVLIQAYHRIPTLTAL